MAIITLKSDSLTQAQQDALIAKNIRIIGSEGERIGKTFDCVDATQGQNLSVEQFEFVSGLSWVAQVVPYKSEYVAQKLSQQLANK